MISSKWTQKPHHNMRSCRYHSSTLPTSFHPPIQFILLQWVTQHSVTPISSRSRTRRMDEPAYIRVDVWKKVQKKTSFTGHRPTHAQIQKARTFKDTSSLSPDFFLLNLLHVVTNFSIRLHNITDGSTNTTLNTAKSIHTIPPPVATSDDKVPKPHSNADPLICNIFVIPPKISIPYNFYFDPLVGVLRFQLGDLSRYICGKKFLF